MLVKSISYNKNLNGQAKGNALSMNQKVHACKMDDCLLFD